VLAPIEIRLVLVGRSAVPMQCCEPRALQERLLESGYDRYTLSSSCNVTISLDHQDRSGRIEVQPSLKRSGKHVSVQDLQLFKPARPCPRCGQASSNTTVSTEGTAPCAHHQRVITP
jgi:hypothetical protein